MEFIKTNKYLKGHFNRRIDFNELKVLEKIKVNQSLALSTEKRNISLLKKYGKMRLKVIPIRRFSKKDWSRRIEFPNRVLLELTSRCNMNCRMCPRQNLKRPQIDFEKELYLKVVNELDKYGLEQLSLFNLGEPILHPHWKEIVNYVCLKNNLGTIWLSTNGLAFNEDCINFVLNSGINFLNYSLLGTNEEVFGYVSSKECYKKVRNHLEILIKKKLELGKGPIIRIQMINQGGAKDNINEFIETFYSTGEIVSIDFLEYVNLPNNKEGVQQRQRPLIVEKCNRLSRGDCFIVSNGDVQPCDATYNSEILLGNIKEKTVYECWNSKTRKLMIELNNKGELYKIDHCKKCTDFDL